MHEGVRSWLRPTAPMPLTATESEAITSAVGEGWLLADGRRVSVMKGTRAPA